MAHAARTTAFTGVTVALALLATGGTAVAAPATSRGRASIVVHTTGRHTVSAPVATRPGVAKLSNTGSQAIFLVTPRHSAGKATFARDLNAETPAAMIANFTVVDALPAKAITYLRLARGSYYLADTSRDTFTAASIATLRVAGSTSNAIVPRARLVAVTSHDKLGAPTTLPTSSQLRFRNDSAHLQGIFIAPVAKRVPTSALNAFLAKPTLDKLYTMVSGAPAFLAMLSPRGHASSSHHSTGGRYLILTFEYTSHTTEPHLSSGQVRLTTVK